MSKAKPPSRLHQRLIPWLSNPRGLAVDRWLVRLTGFSFMGRMYERAGGSTPRPHLLVETTHWKTGIRKTIVLPYQVIEDRYVVVGSHGGRPTDPIWALNLRAHPQVWVRPKTSSWVRPKGGARQFCQAHRARGAERELLWKVVSEGGAYLHYKKTAHPRVIPLFVLDPEPQRIRPDEDWADES